MRCRHLLQEIYNTDLPDPSVVVVQWTKTKSGFGRFVDHSWGHLRNKPSKQTGHIDRLPSSNLPWQKRVDLSRGTKPKVVGHKQSSGA